MVVRNQEFNSNSCSLLDHFTWLCEIFAWLCEIFAWLCEIFAWSCEISLAILLCLQHNSTFWSISHSHANGNIWFLSFLLSFIPFPSSDSTSTTSKSTQILVQTNCITSFLMHLDHHQHYLFSLIWFISFVTTLSKSYLEMTPKLHKTC